MATADTARLIASLELKDQFTPGVNRALIGIGRLEGGLSRAEKAGQQVGTGLRRGAVIAAGAVGLLATQVHAGLQSLIALESATAQTNAVLTSTKGIAGQTAASIRDLAEKYEALNATMDDKVIQSGANVLLTFTNIRKQAFEPALAAALDLSTAMGTDLQGSIVQVGKALSDPIKGITALTRVGVTFTKQQKDQIKALVETGDSLGAQRIILAELNKEFGGSFLAGGATTAGKVAKFQDAIEDLQKALATALLPTIGKVADGLSKFLADPKVIKGAEELGKSIASLFSDKNLATGGAFLKDAFETAKSAAPVVAAAAKATFSMVQGAVSLFKSLPPGLQTILVSGFAINKLTGGLVTNLAGGLIEAVVKRLVSAVVNVTGATVIVNGGVGGVPGAAGAGGLAGTIKSLLKIAIPAAIGIAIVEGFIQGNKADEARRAAGQPTFYGTGNAPAKFGGGVTPVNIVGVKTGLLDRGGRETGRATFGEGKVADDRVNLAQLARGTNALLSDGFRQMIANLRGASKAKDIQAAVRKAVELAVTKGRGNVDATKTLLTTLKNQLKNTHDPATARILRAAIAKVQAKIPGREFAQRQIAKADALIRDGKVTNRDLKDLKAIERSLRDRGLPQAANRIREKIDAAKAAQVKASRAAGQQAAFAIRDKDLSVSVSVPITNTVQVSGRDVVRISTRLSRLANVPR